MIDFIFYKQQIIFCYENLTIFDTKNMPELSRFYGIIIYLYAKDHSPPHFHAKYGDMWAVFSIEKIELLEGNLPKRALQFVKEWASLHEEELMINWIEGQSDNPKFFKIDPLD